MSHDLATLDFQHLIKKVKGRRRYYKMADLETYLSTRGITGKTTQVAEILAGLNVHVEPLNQPIIISSAAEMERVFGQPCPLPDDNTAAAMAARILSRSVDESYIVRISDD